MHADNFKSESDEITKRFRDRDRSEMNFYNILNPDVYLRKQELERAIIRWLKVKNFPNLSDLKLLEIGCGSGSNLLKFIELGFNPKNIIGNDLLSERLAKARSILPNEVELFEGDFLEAEFPLNSFDIIFQSTVFSSILNQNYQAALAKKIWELCKPGGGILWYDFTFNNPNNPNVKKVTLAELGELFPLGKINHWRLTLAPPLSRLVTKVHPGLYYVFNLFPFLRTHILCWIEK